MKKRSALGFGLIVFGLILAFVFPIMAIVGIPVYDYPPSQTIPDGIPFHNMPSQKFHVNENLSVRELSLGIYFEEGIAIDERTGVLIMINDNIGSAERKDGETKFVCLSIGISEIHTGVSEYYPAHITKVVKEGSGASLTCNLAWEPDNPNFLDNFTLHAGRKYTISAVSVDYDEKTIIIPGLYWQWSNIAPPKGEGWVATYHVDGRGVSIPDNVFSFKVIASFEETETLPDDDDTPPTQPPDDEDNKIDEGEVAKSMVVVLGPILFASGVVVFLSGYKYFNKLFGYILLAIIWILSFAGLFFAVNPGVI